MAPTATASWPAEEWIAADHLAGQRQRIAGGLELADQDHGLEPLGEVVAVEAVEVERVGRRQDGRGLAGGVRG